MAEIQEPPTKDHTVPQVEPQVKLEPFGDDEAAQIGEKLEKRLGPEWVASRQGPGGAKLHYLTGEKAIILANSIFGFRGWSSTIKDIKVDFVDEHNSKVSLGVAITMRITLKDGTFHEDIGYGTSDNVKGKGAAFERARKAAVTDGLKRALRTFGNLMGTCLYDKTYLQQISKMRAMPTKYNPDDFYRHPEFAPAASKKEEAPSAPTVEHSVNTTHLVADYNDEEMDAFDFDDLDDVQFPQGGQDLTRRNISVEFVRPLAPPNGRPPPQSNPPGMSLMARYKAEQAAAAAAAGLNSSVTANLQPTSMAKGIDHGQARPAAGGNTHAMKGAANQAPNAQLGSPVNQDLPVSFYSARAVAEQQHGGNSNIARDQVFNPHSQHPALSKVWTSGVDHSRSAAVKRESAPQDLRASIGASRPVYKQQVASDFANPHLDPNRMVGMPRPPITPGRGAGSFKPPGMLKRPFADAGSARVNVLANSAGIGSDSPGKAQAEPPDQGDAKRTRIST